MKTKKNSRQLQVLSAKHINILHTVYMSTMPLTEVAKKYKISSSTLSSLIHCELGKQYLIEIDEKPRKQLSALKEKAILKLAELLNSENESIRKDAIKEILKYNFATKTETKHQGSLDIQLDKNFDLL